MKSVGIIFQEPAWPELADRRDDIIDGESVSVAVIDKGTQSGRPTVMIRVDLPDGKVVLVETTAHLFCAAGRAITARYPDLYKDP